jgi:hypothetical protein
MNKSRNLWLIILVNCLIATASSSSGKEDMTGIFPEIQGMSKIREPEIYTPHNLYEYINGAAELYLSYDFRELATLTYENPKEQSLTIEIYRHSNSPNGFGIYSQERPQSGDFLNIGTQGYYEKGILNFVRGSYYVKLISFGLGSDDKSLLISVAQKIANQLEGELSFPRIVYSFPEEGKIENSEKFISQNFLGHSFLKSAFTADYNDANTTFKLFIIKGADAKDCEEMLRQYVQLTGSVQEDLREARYTLPDPYHGDVALSWRGKYIWGVLNLEEENIRIRYLKLMEELLGIRDQF